MSLESVEAWLPIRSISHFDAVLETAQHYQLLRSDITRLVRVQLSALTKLTPLATRFGQGKCIHPYEGPEDPVLKRVVPRLGAVLTPIFIFHICLLLA